MADPSKPPPVDPAKPRKSLKAEPPKVPTADPSKSPNAPPKPDGAIVSKPPPQVATAIITEAPRRVSNATKPTTSPAAPTGAPRRASQSKPPTAATLPASLPPKPRADAAVLLPSPAAPRPPTNPASVPVNAKPAQPNVTVTAPSGPPKAVGRKSETPNITATGGLVVQLPESPTLSPTTTKPLLPTLPKPPTTTPVVLAKPEQHIATTPPQPTKTPGRKSDGPGILGISGQILLPEVVTADNAKPASALPKAAGQAAVPVTPAKPVTPPDASKPRRPSASVPPVAAPVAPTAAQPRKQSASSALPAGVTPPRIPAATVGTVTAPATSKGTDTKSSPTPKTPDKVTFAGLPTNAASQAASSVTSVVQPPPYVPSTAAVTAAPFHTAVTLAPGPVTIPSGTPSSVGSAQTIAKPPTLTSSTAKSLGPAVSAAAHPVGGEAKPGTPAASSVSVAKNAQGPPIPSSTNVASPFTPTPVKAPVITAPSATTTGISSPTPVPSKSQGPTITRPADVPVTASKTNTPIIEKPATADAALLANKPVTPSSNRRKSFLDAPPLVLAERFTTAQAMFDHSQRKQSIKAAAPEFFAKTAAMVEQEKLDALKKEIEMDEHTMSVDQLCKRLEVDPLKGLSDQEVTERLLKYGANSLKVSRKRHQALAWLQQLTIGFSLLLMAGGLFSMLAYVVQLKTSKIAQPENLYIGGMLIFVVIIITTFSYIMQAVSDSIMHSFKRLSPQFTTVIRNGEKRPIVSKDLVLGDIVELKTGDRVPADLRIIESRQLKVDNSSMTGESDHQLRTVEQTDEHPSLTKNLAFYTTYAVEGNGIGVVVRTGENTKIGRLAKLTTSFENHNVALADEMRRFVVFMTIFATAMAGLVFVVSIATRHTWSSSLLLLVGVIVATVPEGIIPATTVALTVCAKRLTKMNCLVKNLSAVELLGTISVICTDKTGTLTQNRMTVSNMWINDTTLKTDTSEPADKEMLDLSAPTIKSLLRCAVLCNAAEFKAEQEGVTTPHASRREIIGDASDAGLLRFAEVNMSNTEVLRTTCKKVLDLPFKAASNFQLSIHEVDEALLDAVLTFENTHPVVPPAVGPSAVLPENVGKAESPVSTTATPEPSATVANGSVESSPDALKPSANAVPGQASRSVLMKVGTVASMTTPSVAVPLVDPQTKTILPAAVSIGAGLQVATSSVPFYHLLVIKGAPESIIPLCSQVEINGTAVGLKPPVAEACHNACAAFANEGERVFGFAELKLDKKFAKGFKFTVTPANYPTKGYVLLGLIALVDPPRSAVPSAVLACREAGIRVVLMTGDHPSTAMAVARAVGIVQRTSETVEEVARRLHCPPEEVKLSDARAAVVTGVTMKEMTKKQISKLLDAHPETVFARISAQQKLVIVEALHESDCRVAVTGDGVNDAPALKRADMGIAMGVSGSDVSRDAAKMVLLDDNFASVVAGIEQGRLICDNLRKAITYMMTSNMPQILPFIVFFLLKGPMPLSVATILYIDLGTDIIPAIALVAEPPEGEIMKRPPRDIRRRRVFNSKMIAVAYMQIGALQTLAAFFMYYVVLAECGFRPNDIPKALWYSRGAITRDSYGQEWTYYQRQEGEKIVQGAFLMTIVFTQFVNVINCRRRRLSFFQRHKWNPEVYIAIFVEAAFFAFLLYSPYVNVTMQVRPPKVRWWLVGIFFGLGIFGYDELRKMHLRRHPEGFMFKETYY